MHRSNTVTDRAVCFLGRFLPKLGGASAPPSFFGRVRPNPRSKTARAGDLGGEGLDQPSQIVLHLQEAGRSLETEALIGSILEMAKLTNTAAPSIESVYALVKLLNKVMLLEGGGVKVEKLGKAA